MEHRGVNSAVCIDGWAAAVAVTVHATNNYFVTASLDSTWCFYELSSGTCLTQVSDSSQGYTSAAFHPDGLILGTGNASFYFATTIGYAFLQIILVIESVSAILNHDRTLTKLTTAKLRNVKSWELHLEYDFNASKTFVVPQVHLILIWKGCFKPHHVK